MRIENVPSPVFEACHERGYSDDQISEMSPIQIFTQYCEWHGLIRWGEKLFEYAVHLDSASPWDSRK